jgi:hypothetical protein
MEKWKTGGKELAHEEKKRIRLDQIRTRSIN